MTRIRLARLAHLAFIVTRVLAVGLLSLPLQTRGQAVTPSLPPEVSQALQKAGIPVQSVSFWVAPLNSQGAPALGAAPRPLLAWRAQAPMNPASVMKLLTTSAALDLLGPDFTWHTPVYADGTLQDGVLRGNLYLQGQGDPTLVVERLWLLLQRVRQWGVEQIQGDIVLDRSAFAPEPVDPGEFDAAPLRPYNVPANALLLNFRAWSATFSPDPNKPIAHVQMNPPLLGVQVPLSVPLTGGRWEGWERGEWRRLWRLAKPIAGPLGPTAAAQLQRQLPGGLRRAGLVHGLRGPRSIRCPAAGRAVAIGGGPIRRQSARWKSPQRTFTVVQPNLSSFG